MNNSENTNTITNDQLRVVENGDEISPTTFNKFPEDFAWHITNNYHDRKRLAEDGGSLINTGAATVDKTLLDLLRKLEAINIQGVGDISVNISSDDEGHTITVTMQIDGLVGISTNEKIDGVKTFEKMKIPQPKTPTDFATLQLLESLAAALATEFATASSIRGGNGVLAVRTSGGFLMKLDQNRLMEILVGNGQPGTWLRDIVDYEVDRYIRSNVVL